MEIEINDKTNNYLNSINYDLPTNNSQNNGDNNTDPIDMEKEKEINLFSKNKKSIYALNQSSNKKNKKISPGEFTLCEGRLLNDLAEFKTSKITGKICKINVNDYKKREDYSFELIVDFISYFSVKFIFKSDYPCSPPSIVYHLGLKPKNIFDDNGNVLIESIKPSNWTPSIWLSTLIYSIELLISSGINCENNCLQNYNDNNLNSTNPNLTNYFMMAKREKYKKRNWNDYLNECNNYYNKETVIIPELEKNLKQLKIK